MTATEVGAQPRRRQLRRVGARGLDLRTTLFDGRDKRVDVVRVGGRSPSASTSGQSSDGVECPVPGRSTMTTRRPVRCAIGARPPYPGVMPRSMPVSSTGLRSEGSGGWT